MGVVVVAVAGQSKPREAGQALALGEHVGGYARLSGREGVDHQVRLDLGDLRIVRKIRDVLRLLDVFAIIGGKAAHRALQVAHRG